VLRYLDPHLKSGAVLGGREIARQLEQHLGHARFESLAIPAAAVAADLLTGEGCIIDHGSVAPAVRASMAVPGVFFPVDIDGRLLVDGGAVMPVPVEAARRLAPGLPVLAINLLGDYHARAYRVRDRWAERKTLSAFGVMRASAGLMLAHLTKQSLELCPPDLELSLPVGHIEPGNFTRASELILIGRMATQEALPKIEALVAA
jgi:NTE family protein